MAVYATTPYMDGLGTRELLIGVMLQHQPMRISFNYTGEVNFFQHVLHSLDFLKPIVHI